MAHFINYTPGNGITINSYRNNGATSGNEEEFIDSLMTEESTNISADDPQGFIRTCKEALEDGEFLKKAEYDNEQLVNDVHSLLSQVGD